jgi:macrolide transport system ATP-binding/permease protein
MTKMRVLLSRLSGLFRKGNLEPDLDDELDFHLQMEISENVRRGMSPDAARSQAMQRFGGVARVKETYRETHSLPFFQVLWQDLRYGFRMLRRSPGFSLLAILCLTLGIGSNAAVYTWIEGILLRPFPLVAHQDRRL